ncbi:MAG TPA: tRNA pseudouridine(55) synthase TruB [Phycisphaerae bacterium]|nr:tRNA pseudouridine(55) synthase TruB [Phycisphaerae bacterium]
MFGLFLVNKPAGPTSHDIVADVRRRLGRGVRVGHAGTLDPFAEGVLVLCVGAATRLASYVQARPKRYRAVVRLGASSSTDDREGEIAPTPGASAAAESAVRDAVGRFLGVIEQVPPAHSAVHVAGQRAYKLARAGQRLELPPRNVTVYSIDLVRYEYPQAEIDVCCGSGTYIRALARDIGSALGVGGYCEKLTRTAVGEFRIENAVGPEALDPCRDLLEPLLAVSHLPRVIATGEQIPRLRHGNLLALAEPLEPGEVAVVDAESRLLALGEVRPDGRTLQPRKAFVTEK